MSIGSPALAAYSLLLTSLNARSVYHRARRVRYGNRTAVVAALTSLQQIPLELTEDPRLLDFIAINDQWRREIEGLRRRNAWSVTTGSSVAWAVIAFLFALVDSFVSIDSVGDSYVGHALGTLWLWLLCLVIGWSWVPTFFSGELKSVLDSANQEAVERTRKAIQKKTQETAKKAMGATTKVADKIQKRLRVSKLTSGSNTPMDKDSLPDDSRYQSTSTFQTAQSFLTVSSNPDANRNAANTARSTQLSINPETDELLISQKVNWLNRDEHRLTATFNHSRIMRYLTLVDDVFRALDKLAWEKEEVSLSREHLSDIVSLIFNRRGGLSLGLFPLSLQRRMYSLQKRLPRCSKQRLWPSFSSAE